MVSWGWIVVALFIGVLFGGALTALMAANDFREDQEMQKRKWWDDE